MGLTHALGYALGYAQEKARQTAEKATHDVAYGAGYARELADPKFVSAYAGKVVREKVGETKLGDALNTYRTVRDIGSKASGYLPYVAGAALLGASAWVLKSEERRLKAIKAKAYALMGLSALCFAGGAYLQLSKKFK